MTLETQTAVTSEIPCYAVVGKVNMGKSAVLATLLEEDDDRIIRISPEPGETTRCQPLSLVLDGVERLRFIDTPGFQQPIEAMRTIKHMHGQAQGTPDQHTLRRFVRDYREDFADECRLLAPLLDGAGVVYVIDPSVPLYDSFRAEIEILRWTGRPRLALLNSKSEHSKPVHEADWRTHLGTAFNLVRSFNAHEARFAARRQLLVALNQIEETHQRNLDATLALLDSEWEQRREQAVEAIIDCLAQAMSWRERGTYHDHGEGSQASDQARAEAVERLGQRYFDQITTLERDCSQTLLNLYRHQTLQAQPWTQLADMLGPELDLARNETWRRLGLSRKQLTTVGATAGASAGLGVDVATLGHTLGLATLAGGLSGGALAFFKGNALPVLALDIGGVSIGGGRQLTLGPPRNPNFGWILLDSLLLRYRAVLAHTHGRRDQSQLQAPQSATASSRVTAMPRERQKALARWFRDCRKGHSMDDQTAVFAALSATLAAIEQELG